MSGTAAIIGAGLAGAKAAETLRNGGFDGRIVLLGEEAERPYDRPSLSKKYLRGEEDVDDVYLHAADFAQRSNVELLTGARVDAIDVAADQLRIEGHADVAFNTLLLATGSVPRRLPIPGAQLPGVHVLRTLSDSQRLREALLGAAHVAVIGAGWIGCEVAASARQMGKDVTIIDPLPTPLHRVLGGRSDLCSPRCTRITAWSCGWAWASSALSEAPRWRRWSSATARASTRTSSCWVSE